jgi:FlaA1/EpsC-like NDP-sugar epimerase
MACKFTHVSSPSILGRIPDVAATRRLVAMRAETVLVTGATGKTGKIIAQKIKDSDDFELRALTRSEKVR